MALWHVGAVGTARLGPRWPQCGAVGRWAAALWRLGAAARAVALALGRRGAVARWHCGTMALCRGGTVGSVRTGTVVPCHGSAVPRWRSDTVGAVGAVCSVGAVDTARWRCGALDTGWALSFNFH